MRKKHMWKRKTSAPGTRDPRRDAGRARSGRRVALLAALAVPVLALAGLSACNSPFESSDADLRGSAENGILTIENRGDRTVHYFVLERNQVAAFSWQPCTIPDDNERCPRIEPGGQVQMPYLEVIGYDEGQVDAKARIFWWHLVDVGLGSLEPDEVRYLDVELD